MNSFVIQSILQILNYNFSHRNIPHVTCSGHFLMHNSSEILAVVILFEMRSRDHLGEKWPVTRDTSLAKPSFLSRSRALRINISQKSKLWYPKPHWKKTCLVRIYLWEKVRETPLQSPCQRCCRTHTKCLTN